MVCLRAVSQPVDAAVRRRPALSYGGLVSSLATMEQALPALRTTSALDVVFPWQLLTHCHHTLEKILICTRPN